MSFRTRLIVDVPGLYGHSRDKLRQLSYNGRSTGGLFGTVKTVDAAVRRFDPELVILAFDAPRVNFTYLADDQLQLSEWGKAHGFASAYLRGSTADGAIQKIILDQTGAENSPDVRWIVQSWNPGLNELLFDERVSILGKAADALYEQEDFVRDFGYTPSRLLRNRSYADGDLATFEPDPSRPKLHAWLSQWGFNSVVEELNSGKVRVLERSVHL